MNATTPPPDILAAPLSVFRGATNPRPISTRPLGAVLAAIRDGAYRQKVESLRALRRQQGEDAYKTAKKSSYGATFAGTFAYRQHAKLLSHSGVVHGDIDHLPDVQATRTRLCGAAHVVYCFVSPSNEGLKLGVRIPQVPDDAQYQYAWQHVSDHFQQQYGVTWDPSGKDICRLCFLSWDADIYVNAQADQFVLPERPRPQHRPVALVRTPLPTDQRERYARQALETAVGILDASTDGGRHTARLKASHLLGGYIGGGILTYDEALAALEPAVQRNTQHVTQSMKTIRDGLAAGQQQAITLEQLEHEREAWRAQHRARHNGQANIPMLRTPAPHLDDERAPGGHATTRHTESQGADSAGNAPPPAESQPRRAVSLGWNDTVNAECFVRDHGHNLRYCYPWKNWLVWNGRYWERDTNGAVMRLAKLTIKRLASHAAGLDDDTQVKALMAHVKRSLSTAALRAMVENAQSEAGVAVSPEAFDANVWLLNCRNGAVDLKTGALRPHTPTDYITRCLDVDFDPDAVCPVWDAFVLHILGASQGTDTPDMTEGELTARQQADDQARELVTFLQRVLGYCLSASVAEQLILILWGSGSNGKSTLINTVLRVLGAYAMKATSELLLMSKNDRHPTERADLYGKRLVAAIETSEGARLNEAFIKEATGGDPIRARRMREDFWEFWPTHKILLASNHKPEVRGTDHAVWRRLRLLPFTVIIPDDEQDKNLPEKLQAEFSGILRWMVEGCLAWQKDGLAEPDAVKMATQSYRREMDVLAQFIEESCILASYAKVKASILYKAYQEWCATHGEHPLVQRNFGLRLTEKHFENRREGTGYFWHGIGVAHFSDDTS